MLKRKKGYIQAIIILLMMSIILTGCMKKESSELNEKLFEDGMERDLRSYFPMIEGMEYEFSGEGDEFASFTREIKYVKKPYVQFHEYSGTVGGFVYEVKEDQISKVFAQTESFEENNILSKLGDDPVIQEIILKTPLTVGNTWETRDKKREIVSLDETVTVQLGTFYDVIKIKVTSTTEGENFEIYEYYAENVGLILKETKGEGYQVRSKLKSYGMNMDVEVVSLKGKNESKIEIGEDKEENQLNNPELALLAYQLEHQIRSLFKSAYESYINMKQLSEHSEKNFEQIYMIFEEGLKEVAAKKLVDQNLRCLRDYYKSGEGDVSFPTYEVVEQAKVLKRVDHSVQVGFLITKYYSNAESGKTYNNTFNYVIDLEKENGHWKVKEITGE